MSQRSRTHNKIISLLSGQVAELLLKLGDNYPNIRSHLNGPLAEQATQLIQLYEQPPRHLDMLEQAVDQVLGLVESPPSIDDVHKNAPDLPNTLEEVTIHYDATVKIKWLDGAMQTSRSVVKVIIPKFENGTIADSQHSVGTGWLIGQQHILTNHHVIRVRPQGANPDRETLEEQCKNGYVYFDFDDKTLPGYRADIASLLAYDPQLDYALLKLHEVPGQREPIRVARDHLSFGPVQERERSVVPVNIIQHPYGEPKQIAFRKNLVTQGDQTTLRYYTDTNEGSSGSPVCNDDWIAVALHKGADRINTTKFFQGQQVHYVNVGTQMSAILQHIPEEYHTHFKIV